MTGPGGSTTKRDERRDARRGQYQQRQLERQRARQREIRRQRTTRLVVTVAGVVLVALLAFVLIHAMTGGGGASSAPTKHGQYTTPAQGETRENLTCFDGTTTQIQQHIHAYMAYYVNGAAVDVTPNTGVFATCAYAVHEHADTPNILHIEAPNTDTYYLGDFFAIWGQHLSATQVGTNVADATHPLTFETIDASGKVTKWPSNKDPWDIPLTAHETIVILYNSPNVHPTAYTNWGKL